ncbi:MAG: hypothetical protein Q9187_001219 [Circinaria calcarea]
MSASPSEQELKDEVDRLERQLAAARSRLKQPASVPAALPNIDHGTYQSLAIISTRPQTNTDNLAPPIQPSTLHALLLLSDSALPLGSFAFSSGLESYLAHHKPLPPTSTPLQSFHRFLHLSLASVAGISIPYIRAAYANPQQLETLDDELDASTLCTVTRRASVAQGRALLGVWERALRPSGPSSPYSVATSPATDTESTHAAAAAAATKALTAFSTSFKVPSSQPQNTDTLPPTGHFAPLWSLVCLSLGIPLAQTAYVFLFNHAKAVLSAAVRAAVMGPYQAQSVLASAWLQAEIHAALEGNWEVGTEEAGQCVPVMELWGGRHELLYSRIFNS